MNNDSMTESAKRAIHLAEEASGKPVSVQYKNHNHCLGSANTTTNKSKPSIVYLDEELDIETQNYIIVHECGHIIRAYENMPGGTEKAIGLNNKKAMSDLARHFNENHKETPPRFFLSELANMMYISLLGAGLDLWVENWIFDNFPELRDKQRSEYAQKIRNSSNFAKDAMNDGAPHIVINSILAVDLAFVKILSKKNPIFIP